MSFSRIIYTMSLIHGSGMKAASGGDMQVLTFDHLIIKANQENVFDMYQLNHGNINS